MEWMLMPLRRYAEFTGRSRRKEYWMFALGITIVYSILFIFLLGWFVLLNLVPYVGGLIVLVMMCLDGTPGANRFGPDPKAGERLAPPETF